MRRILIVLSVFVVALLVYFAIGTEFSFHPKWALDYYNPLAQALMEGRLDLKNPGSITDLALFEGKWYAPWGVLPAVLLIPAQTVVGRYVPLFYLSLLFAALDVVVVYLLIKRFMSTFLDSKIRFYVPLVSTALFAFGTTHFYVGTLGSVWHAQQMVTIFFGNLGLYFILKQDRSFNDYLLSITALSLTMLGRPTVVLLAMFPMGLLLWDIGKKKNIKLNHRLIYLLMPVLVGCSLFLSYNYLRFGSVLNYGHEYINEEPYLVARRNLHGTPSLSNIPYNLRYMLVEIPHFSWDNGIKMDINLKGNSILFLSPPFITAFMALFFLDRAKNKELKYITLLLWSTAIVVMVPSLLHYSSGWMQFGYRYSLDITAILVLLSIIGIGGKLKHWYMIGVLMAVYLHYLGITALQ